MAPTWGLRRRRNLDSLAGSYGFAQPEPPASCIWYFGKVRRDVEQLNLTRMNIKHGGLCSPIYLPRQKPQLTCQCVVINSAVTKPTTPSPHSGLKPFSVTVKDLISRTASHAE